jgi:CRISPR-associated protein Cmr4
MASLIMGLLAETPIHPGVGRNLGVIDLPVAREAATDYPVLVGSGLKGALRDHARVLGDDKLKKLFGKQDDAGQLLISDARLLLLPVRSLTGQYRWATCPHLLERLARDKRRAGLTTEFGPVAVEPYQALAEGQEQKPLFLEEREFTGSGPPPEKVVTEVQGLIGNEEAADRVARQLVILADEDFAWFARYGLAVQARNVLDVEKKTSKNLWYEETLPPDTVMYALIAERNQGGLSDLRDLFKDRPYLQAGGNETIGQGVFLVRLLPEG